MDFIHIKRERMFGFQFERDNRVTSKISLRSYFKIYRFVDVTRNNCNETGYLEITQTKKSCLFLKKKNHAIFYVNDKKLQLLNKVILTLQAC